VLGYALALRGQDLLSLLTSAEEAVFVKS
jgi:hypothetical protein